MRRTLLLLTVLTVVAAACGEDSGGDTSAESSAPTTTSVPTTTTAAADAIDPTAIPLGDGKRGEAPEQGSLWSCASGDELAGPIIDGPWIDEAAGTWNAEEKPAVEGEVSWDAATYEMTVEGDERVFTSTDLPVDHTTGVFPVEDGTEAYEYDRNPNTIEEQTIELRVPANPTETEPSCLGMGAIGIMTSGVVLYNAIDAAGLDAVAHEVQDGCDGHPQEAGQYHYHSLSDCIADAGSGHSPLVGYALDGFGIYGSRGEDGTELTNADLDECHGHTHEIEWDDATVEMYHFHATSEFPYTVGCYHGTPSTFAAGGAPTGGPPGG